MSQESKVEGSAASGPSEVTKGSIRQKIWTYIKENDLATFPKDVKDRIPNYKGSDEAAVKAYELDMFKNAGTIEVNPDKPQQKARFLALEAKKTLLVPSTRLRTGLFNRITPDEDAKPEQLKLFSTTRGVREHSVPVGLDSDIKIDLVVTGCVAVSKEGYRLGKGEGYADLEYGMMMAMGAINKDTLVVTTVHDCQIVDIPESLMEAHDADVDYIVTPTEVIKCNSKRPKPTGIIWSILSQEKLNRCPILKKLRVQEKKEGKDVRIKDEETAPSLEELEEAAQKVDEVDEEAGGDAGPRRYRRRRYYRYQRKPRRSGGDEGDEEKGSASEDQAEGKGKQQRRRRPNRTRRRPNQDGEGPDEGEEGDGDGEGRKPRPKRNPPRRRRFQPGRRKRSQDGSQEGDSEGREGDGDRPRMIRGKTSSVYIGGIPKQLRVSELKDHVKGKEVKPLQVIWHGRNGHAFLVFPKDTEADEALERLCDLSHGDKKLTVQLSKRTQHRRKIAENDGGNDSAKDDNPDGTD